MRVLITGASGHIGSELSKFLAAQGFEIYAVAKENQPHFKEWADIDLAMPHFDFLPQWQPEVIIHLASRGAGKSKERSDLSIIDANYRMFKNLAGYIKRVRLFINFGSDLEYANAPDIYTEEYPVRPTDAYSLSKIMISSYAQLLYTLHRNIITIRPFSVYGLNDYNDRFVKMVFLKMLNNEDISVIEGERSFTYIKDVNNAILSIVNSKLPTNLTNNIFNLCAGTCYRFYEAAQSIKTETNSKSTILPTSQIDPRCCRGSNFKIKDTFNVQFKYPLEVAIRDMIHDKLEQ